MKASIKVRSVYPDSDMQLIVIFENDVIKKYDVKQLYDQFPAYRELEDPDIFKSVHVDCGGCAVAWNDELDISECELWENGVPYKTAFDGLLSFSDAANKWGLDDSTLRRAVINGKFIEGIEVKKFGKQWLVTIEAMYKYFGEPKIQ